MVGKDGLAAGTDVVLSFVLKNACCEQAAPAVCLWASRISACGSQCAEGHCIVIQRQVFDRDYLSIPTSGISMCKDLHARVPIPMQ